MMTWDTKWITHHKIAREFNDMITSDVSHLENNEVNERLTVVKKPDNSQSRELTIDGLTDKIEHYQCHVKLWPQIFTRVCTQ